jgi:regulatory protein
VSSKSPLSADDAFHLCAKWLEAADKTEAELRTRLEKRGVPTDSVDSAIDRLKSLGWQDDQRVIDREVELSQTRRGIGKLKTAQRLVRRGLEPDQAEDAVSGFDEASERKRALEVLRKKLKANDGPAKAGRMLASRGFDEEVIRSVLEEHFGDWEGSDHGA